MDLVHKDDNQTEVQETVEGPDGPTTETVWIVEEGIAQCVLSIVTQQITGIDLTDYYPSVEWDILKVPGKRHSKRSGWAAFGQIPHGIPI